MWPLKESAQPANLERGYATLVTVTDPHAAACDFRQPFVGHAYAQRTDAARRTLVTGAERRLRSPEPENPRRRHAECRTIALLSPS